MIAALIAAFGSHASNCATQTNDSHVEIFDCYHCPPGQQRSYVRTTAIQPVHFVLNNPSKAIIFFTALDNCLFNSTDGQRCDFMIGNLQKLFFVEIKDGNANQRRQNRAQAVEQLDATLTIMKTVLPLLSTELIAVVRTRAKKQHPIQTAERVNKVVLFRQKHNAALMDGNYATF